MNNCTKTALSYSTLFLFIVLFKYDTFSQNKFTSIKKNVNPDAKNLVHNLSNSGDSLILKNNTLIFRVEFISHKGSKIIDLDPPGNSTDISIKDLSVGNYTTLIYEREKIIVFEIKRLSEFDDVKIFSQELVKNNEILDKTNLNIQLKLEKLKDENNKIVLNKAEANPTQSNKKQNYNISSLNRENVQTREDYRRTNLRPNGKPYY